MYIFSKNFSTKSCGSCGNQRPYCVQASPTVSSTQLLSHLCRQKCSSCPSSPDENEPVSKLVLNICFHTFFRIRSLNFECSKYVLCISHTSKSCSHLSLKRHFLIFVFRNALKLFYILLRLPMFLV